MATIPIQRMATGTHMDLLQSNLRKIQERLAKREVEISTGDRLQHASDDPLAAVRSLNFQANIERVDQYLRNIQIASAELNVADGALGSLGDIVDRANQILVSQIGDTATAETRRNAATEIQQLLEGAVAAANQKVGQRFIFGGTDALSAPVALVGGFAAFNPAAATTPGVDIGRGETVRRSASGLEVFGAMSAEILGRADLDPLARPSTRLADLHGGSGVRPGSIRIADGLGASAAVDMTGAETLQDVLDRINATGVVTASLDGAGRIALAAPGGSITVTEVEQGRSALDLGIRATAAGSSFSGSDLDPRITLSTRLADLRGGAGIDLAGFTVQNGASTAMVPLADAETVEDLLNAVNGSGQFLAASINGAANGIDIRSSLSGAELTISEGPGSTAVQLGLVIPFNLVDLDRLNGGLGVGQESGDDLRITTRGGVSFDVDLGGARTVQDVIDRINQDPENPGTVTASVSAAGNRIELADSSSGAGSLGVHSLNGGYSAENLGIAGDAPAPGDHITGQDLKPSGVRVDSVFNALIAIREGLLADDKSLMSLGGRSLESASARLLDARADVGARVQRLESTTTRLEDEKIGFQKLLSEERGVDMAQAVTEFQQEQIVLQATYAVTGRILSLSLLDFLR